MQPTPRLKSVVCHLFTKSVVCRLIICCLSFASLLNSLLAEQTPAPLVTALDIRTLTPSEADEHRQVRLRGTVVFVDGNNAVFLQDETAGTLFWRNKALPPPQPGDLVEVEGKTRYGLYVPGIEEDHHHVISRGSMPAPIDATYEDLLSGRYHYQWVRIEGIARSLHETTDTRPPSAASATNSQPIQRHILRVAMGSRVVEVRLNQPPSHPGLIDSRVSITGLASGSINDRRQLVLPYLWPHDDSGIQILEPAPDATQLPLTLIEDLLTFHPSGRSTGHRVRTGGIVLAAFPNGRVYLRDETAALAVTIPNAPALHPGEQIEVLGFAEMDRFSASLADATLLNRQPGPAPLAATPPMRDLMRGTYDNDLITLTAQVTETFQSESGPLLLLQAEQRTIRTQLPPGTPVPSIGSQIRITGICQVETSKLVAYQSQPQTLSLHPRHPDDIVLLQTASWWTTRRLTTALIALAIAMSLAALWIVLLRREVETQTDALRDHIEQQAMLEERQRIAREFHDTLEQDLTGLSLQLGAAASVPPERNPALIDTARHLVSRIQTETRNLLSDLRTPADQTLPFPEILQKLAQSRSSGTGPTISVNSPHEIPTLPPRTLHHLRMIAQESLANAVRHADAQHIQLTLTQQDGHLHLIIADDGKGFDPAETWEKPGHYGCMGMRERARKLGAQVQWQSQPGQGTTVSIQLPLNEPSR